ncbi:MAG: sialate O-acetylesterase [Methylophilus sp.]|jgi:hypothetical protein
MDTIISTGTPFGNLDAGAPFTGIAGAFDGNIVANNPNFGAYRSGTTAYVGKTLSVAKTPNKAVIYGWNDRGIVDEGTNGTVFVYGSNTVPLNGTDGTILAQASFTEPSSLAHGSPLTIPVNVAETYTNLWVYIASTSGVGICIAEVEFYEYTSAPVGKASAIFIGAGQSNMVGAASIPSQSVYANRSRVKSFALDGTIKPAQDPLMDTTGSLWTQYVSQSTLCGSMLSFASHIVGSFKNFDALIVNSSKGSTSIDQWNKGGALYDGMIQRTQAALAAAPYGSFIAGMVWQQGESDSYTEATASNWSIKIKQLIENVRADLNLPDLPIVIIGLSGYDAFGAGWPLLRFSQQYMTWPTNVKYVKTFDLPVPTGADWTDTNSVLTIGTRASNVMLTMLPDVV